MDQLSFDDVPAEPPPVAGDDLYVIGEGGKCGVVKIGRAVSPRKRLSAIQVGNPRLLRILHVEEGAGEFEQLVHRHVRGTRLHGEWFDLGQRDPVAEVQKALKVARNPPPLAAADLRRTGLHRSPWRMRLILANLSGALLGPAEAADIIAMAAHKEGGPPKFGIAPAPLPWTMTDSGLGIRPRDLETWICERIDEAA
jgi:hypothetical protein